MFFKLDSKLLLTFITFAFLSTAFGAENSQESKQIDNYIKNRSLINTVAPDSSNQRYKLQGGLFSKYQDQNAIASNVDLGVSKTQVFIGILTGVTLTSVRDNKHTLPNINIKLGYQNFLGAYGNYFGIRVYVDNLYASNLLSRFFELPNLDGFVDTSLNLASINVDLMADIPLSKYVKGGLSAGYGIGYMQYSDEYWDSLKGLSANVNLEASLLLFDRHRISFRIGKIFYYYGSFVTRRLSVTSDFRQADFASPLNIDLGYSYAF
ncbi:hypothetical protein BKH43_06710 [Helicobacter sp. 13S00401-1]|uniref:hypothetical protein n=1 Tax=Helicobacter sp. 13S00401-1 TaxID=1905758 RepID=UPI000BA68AD5|nr:hypothetical protein [Helicobacter sp. 13S00401-1]PAF49337.1 hypothetical protein BKH43_06710 [Helicobacter sp. 13S00401-1]